MLVSSPWLLHMVDILSQQVDMQNIRLAPYESYPSSVIK